MARVADPPRKNTRGRYHAIVHLSTGARGVGGRDAPLVSYRESRGGRAPGFRVTCRPVGRFAERPDGWRTAASGATRGPGRGRAFRIVEHVKDAPGNPVDTMRRGRYKTRKALS